MIIKSVLHVFDQTFSSLDLFSVRLYLWGERIRRKEKQDVSFNLVLFFAPSAAVSFSSFFLTLSKDEFELSGPDVGAGKVIVAFAWNQHFHFHLWWFNNPFLIAALAYICAGISHCQDLARIALSPPASPSCPPDSITHFSSHICWGLTWRSISLPAERGLFSIQLRVLVCQLTAGYSVCILGRQPSHSQPCDLWPCW